MTRSITMKTLFGTAVAATMMSLASCGGGENENSAQETKPKTELEIAQDNLRLAQEQYDKDSLAFMEADSVSAKIRLQRLKQLETEYHRISPEDNTELGKSFYDFYKASAEMLGEEVPTDTNAVKLENAIKDAQFEYDKSTGKFAQKSKLNRDKARQEIEDIKAREIERARQDSINRVEAKNRRQQDSIRLAQRDKAAKDFRELQKAVKRQQREEYEQFQKIKKELDKRTKAHKDSVMKEFEKLEKK